MGCPLLPLDLLDAFFNFFLPANGQQKVAKDSRLIGRQGAYHKAEMV